MEYQIITSEQNVIIKHIKGLRLKKNRQKHKNYIIEGVRAINEAIKNNVALEKVIFSKTLYSVEGGKSLLKQVEEKLSAIEITPELMKKLSDTENPQGIIALAKIKDNSLADIIISPKDLVVVLDRIQDPGNLGTIIRTAEAAGAKAVILTKGSVDPYNTKTIRGTMGALFHVPIIICNEDQEWLQFIKDNRIRLIASDVEAPKSYNDIEYTGRIAIIIGNEGNGIRRELLNEADEAVKIPIYGKIESLNASVAAALLIYKAIEGRRQENS
ncbi:RNA methyltransferase [Alkaliphilus pronyensis]|uniref:RNA methyltransferase n=1 Tax=Alkaliphilus pronyensis TaxID=1482732 RepID=A0A6I0F0M2_9FIRM|nr:RNA methyltransferase [Alkaliphilus pronyensis]